MEHRVLLPLEFENKSSLGESLWQILDSCPNPNFKVAYEKCDDLSAAGELISEQKPLENELFGHERGAFMGAQGPREGLIKEAEDGTLFLDEVDSLPLLAQIKLLRFLQDKEYRPLGSTKAIKGNVRIIAASNANLEQAVAAGTLRRDLHSRTGGSKRTAHVLGTRFASTRSMLRCSGRCSQP
jgi:hypothetical protein